MHYFVTYKKQLKTKWGVETIFAKFEESSDDPIGYAAARALPVSFHAY